MEVTEATARMACKTNSNAGSEGDRLGVCPLFCAKRGAITCVIICHRMFIFDTSTLILIAKIELLDFFLEQIGMEVAIPRAVEQECCSGKRTLDELMIEKAVNESSIKVKSVRNRGLITRLKEDFGMAAGESEAIALALQERASLVGIDDRQGINACKLLGIPFTTAVAILVRSCERRLIAPDDALNRLAALARYGRYRSSILEEAKRRLEEQL